MENEIEAKDVAEQQTSSHREQQLVQLFGEVIGGLDFAKIAAYSKKPVEDLEAAAKALLGNFLKRFPDIIESSGSGWTIRRCDQGFGSYRVVMHYAVDTSAGLLFQPGKIKEAHALGLIGDEGDPVYPPPVCYACHHPLNARPLAPADTQTPTNDGQD